MKLCPFFHSGMTKYGANSTTPILVEIEERSVLTHFNRVKLTDNYYNHKWDYLDRIHTIVPVAVRCLFDLTLSKYSYIRNDESIHTIVTVKFPSNHAYKNILKGCDQTENPPTLQCKSIFKFFLRGWSHRRGKRQHSGAFICIIKWSIWHARRFPLAEENTCYFCANHLWEDH